MKRFLGILLALVMTMAVSTTAFAAENETTNNNTVKATKYDVKLNSDGIVSVSDENGSVVPLSSISGYANGNVSSGSSYFLVWVDSSGVGCMGVTVKTSCSNWNGTITFSLVSDRGSTAISNQSIPTNGERQYNNLIHGLPAQPAYYVANFSGIPAGYTVHAEVWIYG